ncbi:serine protease [Nocardia sp. NPDC059177]|uniref:serine protease n=1 Tax=Nocardia sp. NPDC059177 TaxID=3346759 RepID=UPI003694ED59
MSRAVAAAGVVLSVLGAVTAGQVGVADAAAPAVLGGGSGILVNDATCTLTTIGHDSAGRLVGLTAAHCGPEGASIVAEQNADAGTVGTIGYRSEAMDYSVITFDPDLVVPVNRVGNTTITGVGGPAQFPDIACKEGRTTAQTCGLAYGDPLQSEIATLTQICVVAGDSGGPVVVGSTLVGMVNGYVYVPCLGPEVGMNITTILADIDARGDLGAGFRPI